MDLSKIWQSITNFLGVSRNLCDQYNIKIKSDGVIARSADDKQHVPLYNGDTLYAIDLGNGFYFILSYQTKNMQMPAESTDDDKSPEHSGYVAGKFLSINAADCVMQQVNPPVYWHSLETDYSVDNAVDEEHKVRNETLNCSYNTPATSSRDTITNAFVPSNGEDNNSSKNKPFNNPNLVINEVTYQLDLSSYFESKDIRAEGIIGILGAPHQFTAITDPRISGVVFDKDNNKIVASKDHRLDDTYLGRNYATHIIKMMPLLIITPGNPVFNMTGTFQSKRNGFQELWNAINGIESQQGSLVYSGKYYSIEFDYINYYKYVNLMLRAAAVFLGIDKEQYQGISLNNVNWYKVTNSRSEEAESVNNPHYSYIANILRDLFGRTGEINTGNDCVMLYANCGESVQESYGNDITQSQFAGMINSLSDQAREYQFIAGGIGTALVGGSETINNYRRGSGGIIDSIRGAFDGLSADWMPTGIQKIAGSLTALLAGGRLVFPDIWSNSSFSRTYSVNMKLVSPSGDRLSVYFNILVPLYHILALCLPKQAYQNSQGYEAPFILRCYYRGMFNIDMGMIQSLSVTKGADGEWTKDGIPTVAEIQFEIKDMYHEMFMSQNALELFNNVTEMDYIANCCGINVNSSEATRAWKLYRTIEGENLLSDYIDNDIVGKLHQYLNNKISNMFGFSNWL